MRRFISALILALAPAIAHAQSAPANTAAAPAAVAPAASAQHYTTSATDIGTLIDDPASKAILEKYVPGMTTDDQIDMARGMTMKDIQQYSPDKITDKILADIDGDFAKLPAKPASGK